MQQKIQPVRTASFVTSIVFLAALIALPSTGAAETEGGAKQIIEEGMLVIPEQSADVQRLHPRVAPKEDVAPGPSDVLKATTVIQQEGFEGAFPGPWTLLGSGDIYWDDVSNRSHTGSWSGWCAGGGNNAQADGANYLDDMDAWLIYGPL